MSDEHKTPDTPESLALWVWDKFVGCPITEPYDAMYLLLLERLKFMHRATFTAGLHEGLSQSKTIPSAELSAARQREERLRQEVWLLKETLEQFATCDLNESNCASLAVATRRIRNIAQQALDGKRRERWAAESLADGHAGTVGHATRDSK